jgi:hypothetical protein
VFQKTVQPSLSTLARAQEDLSYNAFFAHKTEARVVTLICEKKLKNTLLYHLGGLRPTWDELKEVKKKGSDRQRPEAMGCAFTKKARI